MKYKNSYQYSNPTRCRICEKRKVILGMTRLDILWEIYVGNLASGQPSAECDEARKKLINALECVRDFSDYNRIDVAIEEVICISGFDCFVEGYELALSLCQTKQERGIAK